MGTKTLISPEEYLRMSFPDQEPEFVDGELLERSMSNIPHSEVQRELVFRFRKEQERVPLYAYPELRLPVAPGRFRIADLSVYAHREVAGDYPSTPPYVIAEIISPDDRFDNVIARSEEYKAWGVPHVWLIDPARRLLQVFSGGSLTAVKAFELAEFGIRITAEDLLGA